jgi:hypothetical protein
MNLKNRKPIFVPFEFQYEIEQLSKAALMDMVWDYALRNSNEQRPDEAMAEFRHRREIILTRRNRAAP